jgi:hypothetical protein
LVTRPEDVLSTYQDRQYAPAVPWGLQQGQQQYAQPQQQYGQPVYAEEVAYGKGRKPKMPKKMMVGTDPRTYTPAHLLAEGGALIKNNPAEFHSSVYPPALASYAHSFPKGKDAYGRGLPRYSKSPISKPFTAVKKATGGARSARGAIVAEVMKKHGLSLAEASKFVKEKGLY